MDLPRPRKRRWPRRVALAGAGAAAIGTLMVGLAQVQPAAPSVARASVWVDRARRGEMVRQVRGHGALVPEEIRWVTATSPGRIERIALLPGVAVTAATVLVVLDNPELRQRAIELGAQVRAAEAQGARLDVRLASERLAQVAAIAALRAELAVAQIEAEGDEALRARGHGPALAARRSRARADELSRRIALEEERLGMLARAARAERIVQEAERSRLRAQQRLAEEQLAALEVRAGTDGVLQRLGDEQPLRVGQHVVPGAPIARVANQAKLKAEIKIAETQAKDVQLGQAAAVDTRNGIVAGHVCRVDPAVQAGTVTVDVALAGPLPPGARPDLSVDGTITLERLEGVLHVGRPVGAPEGRAGLFKLVDGGRAAVRVPVRLGRASVDAVEIVEGLAAGDELILSDMSRFDAHDRVRLE